MQSEGIVTTNIQFTLSSPTSSLLIYVHSYTPQGLFA